MERAKGAALARARGLCEESGASLLYLTVFGSRLYGTESEASDLDFRGLFLPSPASLALGEDRGSLRFSSGEGASRNGPGDVDIELFSVRSWALRLLPEGDMGALDLLFSPSRPDLALCRSPLLDPIFNRPLKFLNLAAHEAHAQYALRQAKKYGLKGTRAAAAKAVCKWLEKNEAPGKLENYIEEIAGAAGHSKYCAPCGSPSAPALNLCGKIHEGKISMAEFRKRAARAMAQWGERSLAADENRGVDYKALSHAFRALDEMEELLQTGSVRFPRATRGELMRIKRGEIPWPELEPLLLARLAKAGELYAALAPGYAWDKGYARQCLLYCHGLAPAPN